MTREHKLALIVGFALILVVGVFVSDHFSKARLAKPDDRLAMSPGMPASGQAPPVDYPKLEPAPPLVATAPTPTQSEHQPGELVNGQRPRLDGSAGGDTSRGPGLAGAGGSGARLDPPAATPPTKDYVPAVRTVDVPGEGVIPLQRETRASETTKPQANPASALPVSSGELRKHTVAKGDSLAKIAGRYYGDSKLWRKLADYNRSKVGEDAAVNTGVTLLVPPRDVLMGQATLAPEGSRVPAGVPGAKTKIDLAKTNPAGVTPPKPGTNAKPDVKKPVERAYTVKSGDTLALIAERELGSGKRWREIQRMNAGVLGEDDTITVGMVLKLPARS